MAKAGKKKAIKKNKDHSGLSNKQKIISLCAKINQNEGSGSIYTLDSKYVNLKIDRWSTGIEDLDNIIGGGMPRGRVIEIFGPEASGKTTLLYHLCGMHDLCLDIPIEGTFDAERAKIFGNRAKQMLVYRASYGEDAFNKMLKFAKLGIPLIGVDSVPSLVPKDDATKVHKASDNDTIENQTIGGTARLIAKHLPQIEEVIELTGTTLVFINQVRDLMNAMMFGEKTTTPGGRKLKHACSLRIQVARRAWIEIPNYNPSNSATTEKIGLILKCKVVKSKVCNPMGECEIPLIFDRGFVSFDSLKEIREEIKEDHKAKYRKRNK